MNNIEERIIRLETNHVMLDSQLREMRAEHKEQIAVIKKQMRELNGMLNNITSAVNSIKWWLIGFVSFVAMEQFGVFGVLKRILF